MTNKEIRKVLGFGKSHTLPIDGFPLGVTRFQAFLAIKCLLNNKQYWIALRNAYEGSDNLYEYRHDVNIAFTAEEPMREFLMNKSERNYLDSLPERITIYRAITEKELEHGSFGVSWTLNKKVASFFAKKYTRNYSTNHLSKTIHQLQIYKSEIIAFFNGRKEFEIIYIKDKWQPK